MSTPDAYALYGALGGLGTLAVARRHLGGAVLVAILAALTRNDGFLWGMALGLGFSWRGLAPAIAGLAASAAWQLRGWSLGGSAWVEARTATGNALSYTDLIRGEVHKASLGDRIGTIVGALPDVALFWGVTTLFLLAPFAAWTLWRLRKKPTARVVAAYWFGMPLVALVLAPAVATHGTIYRSGAALFPALCVFGVLGVFAASDRLVEARDYPAAHLPSLICGGFVLGSIAMGVKYAAEARPPVDCVLLNAVPQGATVFSSNPIMLNLSCGHSPVILLRDTKPERVVELADRYGIDWALVADPSHPNEGSAGPSDMAQLLPDWHQVEPRLFRRPPP